jgi:hypothetical protein
LAKCLSKKDCNKTNDRLFRKIGVKQLMILKKCYETGFVTTYDVKIIYNMSSSYRPKYYDLKRKTRLPMLQLEKLKLYGYLNQDGKIFTLTDLGRNLVVR